MKNRKKSLGMLVLLLFIGLLTLGKTVNAASYRRIAYINSTEKRLILKFNEFCSSGYYWSVTSGASTTPILSGSIDGGTNGASKSLKVDLGKYYQAKTKYILTVAAKDKTHSICVGYYSGSALTKATVTTTTKNYMKVSCKVNKEFAGNGGEFLVFKGEDSTYLLANANLTKKASGTWEAAIPPSSLSTGSYKTYSIMNYLIDGTVFYGQGIAANCSYIKPVAKVTGIRLSTANSRVKMTWNPSSGASYYKVYQSISRNGKYKLVAKKVYGTTYSREVKGNNTYYYKVEAVGSAGKKVITSGPSGIVSIKVAVTPGKVTGLKFSYDWDENLVIRWSKPINTTGYIIYYKEAKASTYTKLGSTKERVFKLNKLDVNKTYNIKVQSYRKSGSTVTKADSASKVLTIQPATYMKANRQLLLANSVRTIEHVGGNSIYTTRHYSPETKLAFVNVGNYSSDTKYLIWISHYTQQVTIYKGSQGNWKIDRVCDTATGTAASPSPLGVFKTTYKETGWFYVSTKELYVTHWCNRNSFHTRPLYNDGSVCTPTIGRPASHGCARLYNDDAKYIYDNIPSGTTVVSY